MEGDQNRNGEDRQPTAGDLYIRQVEQWAVLQGDKMTPAMLFIRDMGLELGRRFQEDIASSQPWAFKVELALLEKSCLEESDVSDLPRTIIGHNPQAYRAFELYAQAFAVQAFGPDFFTEQSKPVPWYRRIGQSILLRLRHR